MTDYYEHKLDPVGVRPPWLADGDMCDVRMPNQDYWSKSGFMARSDGWNFADDHIYAIRIPRDHWAVPALERGFKPWPGGERAPSDWDGGEVLYANGETDAIADNWRRRDIERAIIGYRPKPTASERPEYSPELVERMERMVRDVATGWTAISTTAAVNEARAILSELDKSKEVDPLVEMMTREQFGWDGDQADCIIRDIRKGLDNLGYAITRKDEAA